MPNRSRGQGRGQWAVGAAAFAGALAGAGCTVVKNPGAPAAVIVHSPIHGPTVISGGGPGLLPPHAAVPAGERSGLYSGTATVLDTGGGVCLRNKQVSGFRVSGDRIRWNGFRGAIDRNGGVQAVYGMTWLYGQFVGDVFQGEVSHWTAFGTPGCTYVMELRKSGE